MNPPAEFRLYEKVVVRAAPASAATLIDGQTGFVVGRAQSETGEWSYAVSMHGDQTCWSILEEELESMGAFEDSGAR